MEELWKLESVELTEARQFVAKLTERLRTTRDPALLGELVDYYFQNGSKRARKVLTSLREAHSQDYFDKLHESIQKTSTRLPVLKLLAHTLNSETSWLYRIVDHPLFTAIKDQLKTSNDIVVLCSGVFVVTAILPQVPSYISGHLQELFEIFCSLATIRDTNRLGLTPKELCLHLDVAVYYFFLQLYALFPNNLFQYLRLHYSQAGEQFNQSIAPLFYQVQLHPSLVTGGASHELSRSKWGAMEPDDIATLSLQLCLDKHLAEHHHTQGALMTSQQDHTSQTTTFNETTPTNSKLTFLSATPSNTSALSQLPEPAGLKPAEELDHFWSPLATLGSVTPHQSTNISPNDSSRSSVNVLTQPSLHTSTISSPLSDSAVSSTLATPRGTNSTTLFTFKNYSPTASIDSDSLQRQGANAVTQSAVHAPLEESSLLFDPLSQSMHVEPTYSSQGSPVRVPRPRRVPSNHSIKDRVGKFIGRFVTRTTNLQGSNTVNEDFTEIYVSDVDHEATRGGPESSVPLSTGSQELPLEEVGVECMPDSFKNTQQEYTIPQEVSSVRSSRSNSQSSEDSNPYTELRCYSHDGTSIERPSDHPHSFSYPERGPTAHRRVRSSHSEASTTQTVMLLQERLQELVRSNEQLKLPNTKGALSTSTPVNTATGPPGLDVSTESTSTVQHGDIDHTPPPLSHTPPLSGPLTLSLNLNTSPSKPVSSTAPLTSSLPTHTPLSSNANTLGVGLASRLLVKRVSVYSRKSQAGVSECSVESESASHPSPVGLLDQYINRGVVLHKGHFETIPLTELEGVDWNHFGGCPHSEEFGMMQSQVVLLHSQLMFERHQCMQHARRNRTLLSQARSASKAQEQLHTLRDQLSHQNAAINSLQTNLHRRVYAQSSSLKFQETLRTRNQALTTENRALKDSNLQLTEEVLMLRQQNNQLQQQLDHSQSKVSALEDDHTHLQSRLSAAEHLRDEVQLLSRELQVMGDLYEQQKEQSLLLTSRGQQDHPSLPLEIRPEVGVVSAGVQEMGVASARIQELEECIRKREREISALKDRLESVQGKCQARITALEEKYKSMKTVGLQLESHILEVKGRTPLMKKKRHKRSSSHPAVGHTPPSLPPSHPHTPTESQM